MKNLFEKSCEHTQKSLHLPVSDKAAMRVELIKYLEKNPIRRGFFSRFTVLAKGISYITKPVPVFALLLALSMGVGTTYASESALPGDVLYPVKIYVTEEIRGIVAITPEESAQWEVERAKRRLDEASKLVARGTYNAELRAGLETNFTESVDRAQKRILVLTSSGNDDAAFEMSSRFESALRAHQEIFNRLHEKELHAAKKMEKSATEDLLKVVDKQLENAHTIRVTFETKRVDRNRVSVEKKLSQLRNELASVRAFVSSRAPVLSVQSNARVETSIETANRLLDEAQATMKAGDLAQAFITLQSAGRELTQSRMLAQSLVELSIDEPREQEREEKAESRSEKREEIRRDREDINQDQTEKNKKQQIEAVGRKSLEMRIPGEVRIKIGR